MSRIQQSDPAWTPTGSTREATPNVGLSRRYRKVSRQPMRAPGASHLGGGEPKRAAPDKNFRALILGQAALKALALGDKCPYYVGVAQT